MPVIENAATNNFVDDTCRVLAERVRDLVAEARDLDTEFGTLDLAGVLNTDTIVREGEVDVLWSDVTTLRSTLNDLIAAWDAGATAEKIRRLCIRPLRTRGD